MPFLLESPERARASHLEHPLLQQRNEELGQDQDPEERGEIHVTSTCLLAPDAAGTSSHSNFEHRGQVAARYGSVREPSRLHRWAISS